MKQQEILVICQTKLTENNPKPMLKVHNMPILEHIIKKARAEHFTEILIERPSKP